jgi:hypothetical protein
LIFKEIIKVKIIKTVEFKSLECNDKEKEVIMFLENLRFVFLMDKAVKKLGVPERYLEKGGTGK